MGTGNTAASSRKRKQVDDEPSVSDTKQVATSSKKSKKDELALATDEKRLRRFRDKAPQAFAVIYERATTQRFFVLSRKRIPVWDSLEGFEEEVEIAGSTGNIYTVTIARQPTCTCPMGEKNEQCKHIIYVLARVLRAKYEYVYQLALLSCELEDIFSNAPPIVEDGDSLTTGEGDKRRKPIEGDCPICFNEMEVHKPEEIVWCRAACGQNVHKECFEMWAATKRKQAGGSKADVTCPYCRSVWEGDDDLIKMIKKGRPTSEGYVNVADQLGISQHSSISSNTSPQHDMGETGSQGRTMFFPIKSFIRAVRSTMRAASVTFSFVICAITSVLDFDCREDTAYHQAVDYVLQAFLNMDLDTFELTHVDTDANLDVGLGFYLLVSVTVAVFGGILFFLAQWKFGDPGIQEELRGCPNLPSLFRGVHTRFLRRGVIG
ncbi:hypothetical protein NEUTE2DRAFT_51195 [Neurospora tetrasperma FGSC 2509]|nr:hypothetical protein NEUTE2DRAFT_51195 [Neurospora tetrasperma FGSC 2509]